MAAINNLETLLKNKLSFEEQKDLIITICKKLKEHHDKNEFDFLLNPKNISLNFKNQTIILNKKGNNNKELFYLSPEEEFPKFLFGDLDVGNPVNKHTDIYGLAMLMWQILNNGERLYNHMICPYENIIKNIQLKNERPIFVDFKYPKFEDLIKKMWMKFPEDRLTINEVLEILNNI